MNRENARSDISEDGDAEEQLRKEFLRRTGVKVRANVSGARATTMAVGGPLSFFVEPDSVEEVAGCMGAFNDLGLPVRVLGAGSNLLVPDAGISDWVLRLGRGLREFSALGNGRFEVGATMPLMTLSRELSDQGYSGLEFAGGIPASFGGAVSMNAGAHGGEIASLLESVTAVLPDGRREEFSPSSLNFSYRHSELPVGAVVVLATIHLTPSERSRTAALRSEFLMERKARQPLTLPSSGSVFKNPAAEHAAGWYIEQAKLRGQKIGGAQISEMHGNWIVNPQRNASSDDVLQLIELCQREVEQQFRVSLEPEIVRW